MRASQRRPSRATINDIAREAGVSISTVSRVLNQNAPVVPETAQRVWAVVERLEFEPNSAARRLASRHASTIGLLLPEISGAFFPPMLRGIERCANQSGYDLLIHASWQMDRSSRARIPLGEHNTDGLLVFTNSLPDSVLARLYRRGFRSC